MGQGAHQKTVDKQSGCSQVCAAVGLCDQTARSVDGAVSKSLRLLSDVHAGQSSVHSKLQDDTFCQFCTVAVSYIKVSILNLHPPPMYIQALQQVHGLFRS